MKKRKKLEIWPIIRIFYFSFKKFFFIFFLMLDDFNCTLKYNKEKKIYLLNFIKNNLTHVKILYCSQREINRAIFYLGRLQITGKWICR